MEEHENLQELWMVPYADLMTILVLFFLGLYAMAWKAKTPENDKTFHKIESEVAPDGESGKVAKYDVYESEFVKKLLQLLENEKPISKLSDKGRIPVPVHGLKSFISVVEVLPEKIRLSMPSPVLFDTGSAELKTQAKDVLEKIGLGLKNIPGHIVVEGHTDNQKITFAKEFRTNWELAATRAYSVVEVFISMGVQPSRVSIMGYGEYNPIATNETEEGRQQNRRIEIIIMRETTST